MLHVSIHYNLGSFLCNSQGIYVCSKMSVNTLKTFCNV